MKTKASWLLVSLHFAVFAALLGGALTMPRGEFVLVVTDPRRPPDNLLHVIGAAGGSFVSGGRSSWIAVAHSADTDFIDRLHDAGALFVLNHALAVGCQTGV